MSYRPPKRRGATAKRAVIASVAGVVVASLLTWLVVDYAAERPDQVNLGDDTFEVGDAERLAKRIDEQGVPFLFKDPLSSKPGRELYVQHTGDDPEEGWVAIEAYAPGSPRELRCILEWDADAGEFVDRCSRERRRFPADGEGLRTYPAVVEDGEVVVDLR